ncbi:hypothetical protein ABEX38_29810 [Priestia megaterium]
MTDVQMNVRKGKKTREQLNLPVMSYIVCDDWMDKLGEKSFCFWLKLHTMVDRTNEFEKVPTSQSRLAERQGIARTTLHRYLAPLFEYGLIDYVVYEEYHNDGTKPVNIVVYDYPFNDETKMRKPLEKVRNWKDRTSTEYQHSLQGGKQKQDAAVEKIEEEKPSVKFEEAIEIKLDFRNVQLEKNEVNMTHLKEWIQKTKESTEVVLGVIDKLALYKDKIDSTKAFIKSSTKIVKDELKVKKNIEASSIPMFNWLEQ